MISLTVVVCTMPERRHLLGRCLWYLEHQGRDDFQAIIVASKQGKGDKANLALPLVETSHVMFCDDDDWLSERHMSVVLEQPDVDFIGYDAVQQVDGRFGQIIYQETASHICPIRTDLARQVPFDNRYLADIEWTRAVAKTVTSETYVDDQLYYYDKWVPPGGSGWSPPRQVGVWPHDKSRWYWL